VAVSLHSLPREGALKQEGVVGQSSCCSCKVRNRCWGVKLVVLHIGTIDFTFFLIFIVWYKNEHVVLASNVL